MNCWNCEGTDDDPCTRPQCRQMQDGDAIKTAMLAYWEIVRPPFAAQQRERVAEWLCGHYGTGGWGRRTEGAKATWLRSADELLTWLGA